MKKLYITTHAIALLSVLSLSTANAVDADQPQAPTAPKPKLTLEFSSPTELMDAFLDPNKKPEKSFIWWAAQMILMCQQEPHLKTFTTLLGKAAKGDPDKPKVHRATAVSQLFLQYQTYFSKELQDYIRNVGIKRVLAAMTRRAEK